MANDDEWLLNYLYINTYDELGRLDESVRKFLDIQNCFYPPPVVTDLAELSDLSTDNI